MPEGRAECRRESRTFGGEGDAGFADRLPPDGYCTGIVGSRAINNDAAGPLFQMTLVRNPFPFPNVGYFTRYFPDGGMFWLTRNRFPGSYFALTCCSLE